MRNEQGLPVFPEGVTVFPGGVTVFPDGRMDTSNASRYTGLALKTLAMMRSAGTGPRFTKRGRVFYYKDDLDDWLRAGRATSTAQARAARDAV